MGYIMEQHEKSNNILTLLHSKHAIHDVVYSLNKDGALGPHGISAVFFHTYSKVVKKKEIRAV